MSEKSAVVCGGGGFIGGHLVRHLIREGYQVTAVDEHFPYGEPDCETVVADLRDEAQCQDVLAGGTDELYQLAADMGGMEHISSQEAAIVRNNALINLNVLHAAAQAGVDRYLLSSSVCIYRDMRPGEAMIDEDAAYPAQPDNEYGWEKLYAERALQTYARTYGFEARIARFENCYGPHGAWRGGREKAPAALSRKVAQAPDGGSIDVFGGGVTERSFVYVEDLVRGVTTLMGSDERRPTNIGADETITIADLVHLIADIAGKAISINPVEGPLGVASRNFSHRRIQALGWKAEHSLRQGLEETYPWIAAQVERTAAAS